jgi:hypothetical protein
MSVVYECPDCEIRYLDERRCPDCGLFCRRIGTGGSCPSCEERRHQRPHRHRGGDPMN